MASDVEKLQFSWFLIPILFILAQDFAHFAENCDKINKNCFFYRFSSMFLQIKVNSGHKNKLNWNCKPKCFHTIKISKILRISKTWKVSDSLTPGANGQFLKNRSKIGLEGLTIGPFTQKSCDFFTTIKFSFFGVSSIHPTDRFIL